MVGGADATGVQRCPTILFRQDGGRRRVALYLQPYPTQGTLPTPATPTPDFHPYMVLALVHAFAHLPVMQGRTRRGGNILHCVQACLPVLSAPWPVKPEPHRKGVLAAVSIKDKACAHKTFLWGGSWATRASFTTWELRPSSTILRSFGPRGAPLPLAPPVPQIMRPLGGGGLSVLPKVLAGTALLAAAAGTTAYVCRARLASAAASRIVGARIVVGGVDFDIDLLGRRRRRRLRSLRRRVDAGDAHAGGAPERERLYHVGPAVGVRDVVLYDDNDRVALRLPAVRVQVSKDNDEAGTAGPAAMAGRGSVMDVDVVRPHAFLIFDNLMLTRSNWATLATPAATRRRGEAKTAPPRTPPSSSTPTVTRRGHRGARPPDARTEAPAPGGVRLRLVRLVDGADLSVTSSVLGANGAATISSGRPLLPSTVHVSEVVISPADVTSLATLEAVVAALAARAFEMTGTQRGLPSGVGAAVKAYVRAATVQGTAGARAVARGHLRRMREDMEEVDRRVFRHFGPSLQSFRVRCLSGCV